MVWAGAFAFMSSFLFLFFSFVENPDFHISGVSMWGGCGLDCTLTDIDNQGHSAPGLKNGFLQVFRAEELWCV
jgi:hypothetical protein